jgi:DHA2 family multidrug resistance protein
MSHAVPGGAANAAGGSAAEAWRPSVNPWLVALSVMLATFVEVLDTTIVSVAVPNIAGALAATNDEATRVITCYLIANAIILPASGWLSLRFGRKRLMLSCAGLFAVASFMCGSSPTIGVLLVSSALQGIAGGALVPLSQAILMESFPPEKRGMGLAMYSLGLVLAPAIGPVLGGWLTDNYSWRWIFYINIPVCILALFMMWRFVEDPPYVRNAKVGRIDASGFVLIGIWLAAFQFLMDDGQKKDWFGSAYITRLAFVSVVAFVLMLVRESRAGHPIVDLRVFKNRNFLVGSVLMTLMSVAMFSSITGIPLFLQTLMGYTAQLAGEAVAARGIASALAAPLVGYMMSKIDGRWVAAVGLALFGVSTIQLGGIDLTVSTGNFVVPCILQGVALSCIMTSLNTIGVAALPNEQIGNASGIFNLMRNLGGSIGIALTNTFALRGLQSHYAQFIPHATIYDPAYQQQTQALQQGLAPLVGAPQAALQAQGMLQGTLLQQASVMAYIDIFRWTAVLLFVLAPCAFLFKRAMSPRR